MPPSLSTKRYGAAHWRACAAAPNYFDPIRILCGSTPDRTWMIKALRYLLAFSTRKIMVVTMPPKCNYANLASLRRNPNIYGMLKWSVLAQAASSHLGVNN